MDMHERSEQLQRVAAMAEPKLADITARIYNGTAESIFNALVAMTQETTARGDGMTQHNIGDVWRDGRAWKVKLPGGILGLTTKREATAFAAAITPQPKQPTPQVPAPWSPHGNPDHPSRQKGS